MIGLVEAPGYFVMGCHRDYLKLVQSVDGLVIVDLDKGTLISSSDEWVPDLPLKAASSFSTRVSHVCYLQCF